jgi:hypothetical protein
MEFGRKRVGARSALGDPSRRVRDEKPLVHLLLRSSVLCQSINGKLAVAKVLDDFALLLGVAKNLELMALHVFELNHLVIPRGDSPDTGPVAVQVKLHFNCAHALTKSILQLA